MDFQDFNMKVIRLADAKDRMKNSKQIIIMDGACYGYAPEVIEKDDARQK